MNSLEWNGMVCTELDCCTGLTGMEWKKKTKTNKQKRAMHRCIGRSRLNARLDELNHTDDVDTTRTGYKMEEQSQNPIQWPGSRMPMPKSQVQRKKSQVQYERERGAASINFNQKQTQNILNKFQELHGRMQDGSGGGDEKGPRAARCTIHEGA